METDYFYLQHQAFRTHLSVDGEKGNAEHEDDGLLDRGEEEDVEVDETDCEVNAVRGHPDAEPGNGHQDHPQGQLRGHEQSAEELGEGEVSVNG